jgi:hypothetical protein
MRIMQVSLSVPYDPDFTALAQRVHAALMAQLK